MISDDIENLKVQLIQIANERNGQLVLDKEDTNTLVWCLDSFQDRAVELEHGHNPEKGLAALAGENVDAKDGGTNIIPFPRKFKTKGQTA